MKLLRVALLLVAFWASASSSLAQDVPLTISGGDAKVVKVDRVVVVKVDLTVVSSFPFSVTAPAGAGIYFWTYPAGVQAVDKGDKLEITSAPKGELTVNVKAITADWEAKKFVTKFGTVTFAVGEVPPGPKPPVPPGPDPPIPPTPIPVGEFRALIVYETGAALPAKQQAILFDKRVRDYLNAKTPLGPDGKTREWRIYDQHVDASAESPVWKELMAKPRASVPWIVITGKESMHEGPLPGTVEAALELLKKFGG